MTPEAAAAWLVQNADLLPRRGSALDVACGSGRNALWLAEHGLAVLGLDRDPVRLTELQRLAVERRLGLETKACDLEAPGAGLGREQYDVVVVFNYLHRPLFPAILSALRPEGLLVYETFNAAQAARGKPSNPDFLLQPGELLERVCGLEILRYREGDFEDRSVASVVARR